MTRDPSVRAELLRVRDAARQRLLEAEADIERDQQLYQSAWVTFAAMSRALELLPPAAPTAQTRPWVVSQ